MAMTGCIGESLPTNIHTVQTASFLLNNVENRRRKKLWLRLWIEVDQLLFWLDDEQNNQSINSAAIITRSSLAKSWSIGGIISNRQNHIKALPKLVQVIPFYLTKNALFLLIEEKCLVSSTGGGVYTKQLCIVWKVVKWIVNMYSG